MSDDHPRQALAAEQAILSAALNDPRNAAEALYLLSAADFYHPKHALIFGAIAELVEARISPDPITVMARLSAAGELERAGGGAYLHSLYAFPFMAPNIEHYAKQVQATSRLRQLLTAGQRIEQIIHDVEDPSTVAELIADQVGTLSMLLDTPFGGQMRGLYTFADILARPDDTADWIVPGLLDRQDAMMFIAPEGLGKSWLLRQFALCTAAGLHPFRFPARMPAKRALLIDAENSENTLFRSLRSMKIQMGRLADWDGENFKLLAKPEGFDLRDWSEARKVEQVIHEFEPELVCIGPLYKLANRGRDSWDSAAAEVRAVFDRWRGKYGCAFALEHHMPKGDGKERPETPFGGSEWMRWVTHGRRMSELEGGYYELSNFRGGDREYREIPAGLRRGGELPWTPVWDSEELDYHRPQTTSRRGGWRSD